MHAAILFNKPSLPADHPDYASEAGVLESVEAVEAALTGAGNRVTRLDLPADRRAILAAVQKVAADVVVNLFEGLGGVGVGESQVTGVLELLGVAFTGSGSKCLSLVQEKALTKWLLLGAGLPSPAFELVRRDDASSPTRYEKLLSRGQAIVKPAHEDGSLGIGPESIVSDAAALDRQVRLVRQRYGDVLVEQFIAGREFNVGIIALPHPAALPLAEIEFIPGIAPIVSYDAKWTPSAPDYDGTAARCPADVLPKLAAEITRMALAAFQITGCRHYARVDLRVDSAGRPYILEVNANPDIGPTAGFARQVRAHGMSYAQWICQTVQTALSAAQR